MTGELDIIWLILGLPVAIATRALYRRARYAYILRSRTRRDRPAPLPRRSHDRPVRILSNIDLSTGGLRYGK